MSFTWPKSWLAPIDRNKITSTSREYPNGITHQWKPISNSVILSSDTVSSIAWKIISKQKPKFYR